MTSQDSTKPRQTQSEEVVAKAAIRAAPTCPSTSKAKTWNPVERSHRRLVHTDWREPTGTHDF